MSFASPWLLLFLLLVPLAIGGYMLLERRRARRAASWSSAALLPNMVPSSPGSRRYIPLAFFLIGLILLLAGFARPQAKIDVPREGATVVLAVDISGSMDATDVKPTRLLAARAAALQFAKDLPDKYRIALVTFSDRGTVRVPPTYDHEQIGRALPSKAVAEGTALSSGVERAVTVAQRAIGPLEPGVARPPAAILLLSDGSQTVGEVNPAGRRREGAQARDPDLDRLARHASGRARHAEVPGQPGVEDVIQVPPAPAQLREIAQITGGTFFEARTPSQLAQVYKDIGSQIVSDKKKREITAAAAGAAVVFLIAGAVLSGVWFRRIV